MRHFTALRPVALAVAVVFTSATPSIAQAIGLSIESLGVEGVLNNNITVGAAMRMERRAEDLVGKANLDPGVCAGVFQSCQGLFKDQLHPSQRLSQTRGAPTMRADDGNLNFDRHDLTQGGIRLTQDLTLNRGEYGFFARTISFYDVVNDQLKDRFRTLVTAENRDRTGTTGDPVANRYFQRVFGPGEETELERTDSTLRRQLVADVQLLEFNFFGKTIIPGTEKELTFKVGRQTVNWGESTLLVINSINQAQPVNTNNLYRVGFQLEEVFTPINQVFASFEPFEGSTLEAFYQLEWNPVEIPAPGSFMSFVDIGTQNLGQFVNLSFGGSADDLDKVGFFLDNPLALVTATTAHIERNPDREPDGFGQYGIALKNYFEEFNGGTEVSLYFMNYHSKLPYVSFLTGQPSCARAEGNAQGLNAANIVQLLSVCDELPALVVPSANAQFTNDALGYIGGQLAQGNTRILTDIGISGVADLAALGPLLGGNVDANATTFDDLVKLDSGPFFLDYPKNIKMFGVSFNTTLGDYSIQGEVAYRPNLPAQVSVIDVAFAAAQPFLTRCHDLDPATPGNQTGCAGSQGGGTGFDGSANGGRTEFDGSDAVDGCAAGTNCDTVNLILGAAPSSARSFPSFLVPYRGATLGEGFVDANGLATAGVEIPGFERLQVMQYNLGLTQVLGATDNPIGADQILAVAEIGATHVLDMPGLDQLQFDAPGVYYHASAGADGSGADGSRQACSTNRQCVAGPDGGRFNPVQANLRNFATPFSWGYRLVGIFRYESVLPGISLQPFLIWSHDVHGVSPGPAGNFVRGRQSVNFNFETRYKSSFTFTVGHNWFFGGKEQNLYRDRDNLQVFARYLF
jgi:hypothetical protein